MKKKDDNYYIAYLTIDRMVRWKCLSLLARNKSTEEKLSPIAYASRSKSLFPYLFEDKGSLEKCKKSPHVLYVFSTPINRNKDVKFPITLTAKIVVKEVFTGSDIYNWANGNSIVKFEEPDDKKEEWRTAKHISSYEKRAVFLVTRANAITWYEQHPCAIEEKAWKDMRVIVADQNKSDFFAHMDATDSLEEIFGNEPSKGFGSKLQGPRKIKKKDADILDRLIDDRKANTVFVSYRWKPRKNIRKIKKMCKRLLNEKWAVWFDRVVLPTYDESTPYYVNDQLKTLLYDAIDNSRLFISIADENYTGPAKDNEHTSNWAFEEYKYASGKNSSQGPIIRVIYLGEVGKEIKQKVYDGKFSDSNDNYGKRIDDIITKLKKYI